MKIKIKALIVLMLLFVSAFLTSCNTVDKYFYVFVTSYEQQLFPYTPIYYRFNLCVMKSNSDLDLTINGQVVFTRIKIKLYNDFYTCSDRVVIPVDKYGSGSTRLLDAFGDSIFSKRVDFEHRRVASDTAVKLIDYDAHFEGTLKENK